MKPTPLLLTLGGSSSLLTRGQMECRWGHDPRRPAVAGLARAVLGGNRGGGGEGENGDQAAMSASREELLFALALP